MIIVSANKLEKNYGIVNILTNISFNINKGDRVGLIGVNGAGKTTLLNILSKELSYDSGDFFISDATNVGYLKQAEGLNSENTIYEEVLDIFSDLIIMENELKSISHEISHFHEDEKKLESLLKRYDQMLTDFSDKNGYGFRSEINGILNSLAFTKDDNEKKIGTLSGGEKTRLALAKLLLQKPELLLLDEPTNHLDVDTLKWLEQYLKSYSGTLVVISHDRYFLDQVVNRVFEIENHKLNTYEGNYKAYADKKRQRLETELKAYEKQRKEITRQEEIIRRFKQHKTEKLAKRAASREKRLDSIEALEKPTQASSRIKIHFKEGPASGRDALSLIGVSKEFGYGVGKKELFSNVNCEIKKGERVCIVGPNGIGKTTLLKIILGSIKPTDGHIKVGHNINFGYYDQEQELLNLDNTVLNELHSDYRLYDETEIRGLLGRFLFKNEDVYKQVSALSGGEKARLAILKLMISGSNFLIMDEPTNHLDIASKEAFEDSLMTFPGTLLLVSHDRYFLHKVPTRIIELASDGIRNYLGGYEYYLEKKLDEIKPIGYLGELAKNKKSTSKDALVNAEINIPTLKEQRALERQNDKEERSRLQKREKEVKKLEEEIHSIENRIVEINEMLILEEVFTDHEKLYLLTCELAEEKAKQEAIYEIWFSYQN
jgi:ATP-binding cassette subfamily F protein 3